MADPPQGLTDQNLVKINIENEMRGAYLDYAIVDSPLHFAERFLRPARLLHRLLPVVCCLSGGQIFPRLYEFM